MVEFGWWPWSGKRFTLKKVIWTSDPFEGKTEVWIRRKN
jgi:hypothetical protein